jgi:fermentation-respiration switch protein FrsA (DUF1100 family)
MAVKMPVVELPALVGNIGGVVLLLALCGVAFRVLQLDHSFMYYPTRELVATPADTGLPFEEVWFGPENGLHGWFIPGQRDITLVMFHGNAGNISHRVELAGLWHRQLGVNLFLFDYRGYGRSRGRPTEAGLLADAQAAVTYLASRPDVDPERIVYYGESLGGAIAVLVAADLPPYRLIVQSAFASVPEIGRDHLPGLPVSLLTSMRYPARDALSRVESPVLIIHGTADEVVPVRHAHLLYGAAHEPKQLLLLEGVHHNDVPFAGGERYWEGVKRFLA